MNKILLIGNISSKQSEADGQRIKTSLYYKKMIDEGFEVFFVNLKSFKVRFIFILLSIKKYIKKCDRIVLLSGPKGSRYLIPFINKNNKTNKPFVLPLIGTSVLHHSIDKLSDNDKNRFLNGEYSLCKPDLAMENELPRLTYILPETESLSKTFINFFKINNVYTLTNFRDYKLVNRESSIDKPLKLVFLSRVMKQKGIFDLIEVLNDINSNYCNRVFLDIYGAKIFSKNENKIFNQLINNGSIRYLGPISNERVCETLAEYDFLIFPTKFVGEGTPGVIVESLIAGTPVISAAFPQVGVLLKDGYDALFYKMNDNEDLKNKILHVLNNKIIVSQMKQNALRSGEKYTYKKSRDLFLKLVCGIKND